MATPRPSNASAPAERADVLPNTGSANETVAPPDAPDAAVRCDFLAPPEAPDEIGRLGPYRVLGVLGAGGMGMVLRAADPQLGRQIALKVILPQYAARPHARQRFLREARAVAAVDHVHVVPIFHVGEDHGVPYLVMPLLKGESLGTALRRDARPPVPELVRIGREIAEGLAAAHAEHLVHRDIKPGNIWLEGEGRWVRLLDFGLARADETTPTLEESLTASGQFVGTPVYMSPEQARGETVTAASDLFSLGVVLYQMATGIIPFAGPTMMAVLTALATKDPDPPTSYVPDLPLALNTLIGQLLAKDPTQRPRSARAVADALRQIEAALPPVTQAIASPTTMGPATAPETMTATAPRPPRRRRVLAFSIVALLVLLGGSFLAQQQIRIATPKGTLVIDADDPNVEIVVKKNGAVIRDKTRDRELVLEVGDYTIELSEKKDGLKLSTDRFSITRNGMEKVKVWLEKPPLANEEPIPKDLHRKVVEWLLKQGGEVGVILQTGEGPYLHSGDVVPSGLSRISHARWHPRDADALPSQVAAWLRALPAESVIEVWLDHPRWNDDALGRLSTQLQGTKNLRLAVQYPTTVSDKGLKHLLNLTSLKGVTLGYGAGGTLKVSDTAVRELAALPHLDHICLSALPTTDKTVEALVRRGTCRELTLLYTSATEACIPAVLQNEGLESLRLRGIPLRDEHLKKIAGLKKLGGLGVWGPNLTNESVRLLAPLESLWHLEIRECEKLDDGVFVHVAGLKSLTHLHLNGIPKITDVGLAKAKDLLKLQQLSLAENAGITAAGVAKLRAALPKLTVVWDGDTKK